MSWAFVHDTKIQFFIHLFIHSFTNSQTNTFIGTLGQYFESDQDIPSTKIDKFNAKICTKM